MKNNIHNKMAHLYMSNQANWFFIEVLKNSNLKSMAHTKCQIKSTNSK